MVAKLMLSTDLLILKTMQKFDNIETTAAAIYNTIIFPTVKEIFAAASTNENPDFTISSWKAAELLDKYKSDFDKLDENIKNEIKSKICSIVGASLE